MGTMTATATTPPVDSPLEVDDEDAPSVASADDLVDEEAELDETGEYEYGELEPAARFAVEVIYIIVVG